VAISEYVAARFASGLSGAKASLRVIDEPIDLRRFAPRPDRPPADDPRGRALLIVGQISAWKGHDTVIRALHTLRRDHPDVRLTIVGEVKFAGSTTRLDNRAYLAELRLLVAQLGLTDAVDFVGERDDIPELMAGATAVLVPSLEEPFGRTVAEAMAIGTPVVATTVGGPAEVIEDGSTGLLAPPGEPDAWSEAISRILRDPQWAQAMAARASEVARRRFAPERHAAAMIEVFELAQAGGRHTGE
jgi:glycosyltransferase involved in cell wall biosynthesis